MTPRDLQRLAALVLPLVPQLPPHERAEALRLLAPALPPSPPWPYDAGPSYGLAREEHPLAHLEIDPAFQLGPKGA